MMKAKRSSITAFVHNLLRYICPDKLYESIEGDLLEQYDNDIEQVGEKRAVRRFIWNTILFIRPGILLRNKFKVELNQGYMLRNYVKIMLRNMMKQKAYSIINIFGLTLGITFTMLIGVFIWGELQVNQNLSDVDMVYVIESNGMEASSGVPFFSPSPIAKLVKDKYPTLVENYYRMIDRSITVSKDDKHFRLQSIIGDSTMLSMFGFEVAYGDAASALNKPRSIVITEKVALKYFNKTEVTGEILLVSTEAAGEQEYIIRAVLRDMKPTTVTNLNDMDAQIFLPLQSLNDFNSFDPDAWTGAQMIGYVKLTPMASVNDVENAFAKIMTDYAPDQLKDKVKIELACLDDYYLLSNNSIVKKLIQTLTAIVAFILLLAVINFVNITIGSSSIRLKEIGVRKAIGGLKKQIVFQFLTESFMLTCMATLFSLLGYELLRPYMGEALGATLPSLIHIEFSFWKWLIAIVFFIGLLAGTYPSFYLSSYKAIESLRGKVKSVKNGALFSKSLITIQFLLAICIFIFSIVITRQVSYFLGKDLGYSKSAVVTVSSVPRIWTPEGLVKMETAKQEFLKLPQVKATSLSWDIPNGNFGITAEFYREGQQPDQAVVMPTLITDEAYADTYHIEMKEGVFFAKSGEVVQSEKVVINEAAQNAMHVQVGDKIKLKGLDTSFFIVSGVVKDFNFFSLHHKIKPLMFFHPRNNLFLAFRYLSFRLEPEDLNLSLAALQNKWKEIFPNDPFEYAFMDQNLEKLYKTELKLKKASGLATALMLFIVLLGVLGIVSLTVARRTKEIGIRKVLGATASNILILISKDYVALVVTAFIVAVPVTYFFVNRWLSSFAYSIEIQWWMFVLPGAFVFALTLIIVSTKSVMAAMLNPTETLRYE